MSRPLAKAGLVLVGVLIMILKCVLLLRLGRQRR